MSVTPPCIVCGGGGCATSCASPRFVITTGGTYIGSVDVEAALRRLEIERDEARKERDLYKIFLDHAKADAEQAVAILTAERDEARAERNHFKKMLRERADALLTAQAELERMRLRPAKADRASDLSILEYVTDLEHEIERLHARIEQIEAAHVEALRLVKVELDEANREIVDFKADQIRLRGLALRAEKDLADVCQDRDALLAALRGILASGHVATLCYGAPDHGCIPECDAARRAVGLRT